MHLSEIIHGVVQSYIAENKQKKPIYDFINPLPVAKGKIVSDTMDIIDEVYEYMYPDVPFVQRNMLYGTRMEVPIKSIKCIEEKLSSEHIKNIVKNKGDSFEPPLLYLANEIYYAADGNHRIVASYLQGKKTIYCNVLSLDFFNTED